MRHNEPNTNDAAPILIELKERALTLSELKDYYNSPEFQEWLRLARQEYHIKID